MTRFFALALLFLLIAPAFAQAAPDAPALLVPDRPGFTNGSDTVAPGHLQIEIGVTRSHGPSATPAAPGGASPGGGGLTTDAPETLLRTGLDSKTELRLTLPNYLWPSGSSTSGFTDGAIGLRRKLYQSRTLKIALTPTLTVPLKTAVTSSGHVDPSLNLSGQLVSGARWSIQSNLILSYPTQNGRRLADYTGTGSVTYALSGALSAFADFSYDAPVGSAPSPIADAGFAYALTKNIQLDLETGRGLGGSAPTQFYGGGFVIVF